MRLDKFLTESGFSRRGFAVKSKVSEATLSRIVNGKMDIGLAAAFQIEEASAGMVKAEDLPLSRSSRTALKALRGRSK